MLGHQPLELFAGVGGLAIRKESRGCLKGKTIGGDAEQTSNTARGTPGNRHLAATTLV